MDHKECCTLIGESGTFEVDKECINPLRGGIIMPLPPTVGDESGDDSAKVEW